MSWLAHHGIKGQKWGIRRYQNENGTLTEAGRDRYRNIYSKTVSSGAQEWAKTYEDRRRKRLKGIEFREGYDVIKKKTKLYRAADVDRIDDRAKYVSPSTDDRDTYLNSARKGLLPLADRNKARVYTYKAKRDLKVAKAKEVADYILEKYGDEQMKKDYAIDYSVSDLPWMSVPAANRAVDKEDRDIAQYVANRMKNMGSIQTLPAYEDKFIEFYHDKNINSDVINEFAKRGYDAIQDVQDKPFSDYNQDWGVEYPMILLNPKSSIK